MAPAHGCHAKSWSVLHFSLNLWFLWIFYLMCETAPPWLVAVLQRPAAEWVSFPPFAKTTTKPAKHLDFCDSKSLLFSLCWRKERAGGIEQDRYRINDRSIRFQETSRLFKYQINLLITLKNVPSVVLKQCFPPLSWSRPSPFGSAVWEQEER